MNRATLLGAVGAILISAVAAYALTPDNMLGLAFPISVSQGGTGQTVAGPTAANNIGALAIANNLSDVQNAATARSNIGAGTGNGTVTQISTGAGLSGGPINTTGTISLSVPVAVSNGGTGATSAGATAANNIGALAISNDLSDVSNPSQARTNIGAGTGNGTVTSVGSGRGMTGGPITTTGTLATTAEESISFYSGSLLGLGSVGGGAKVVNASTADAITGTATGLICTTNPTLSLFDCTAKTCGSKTLVAHVTMTASGFFDGVIDSSATIPAGDYLVYQFTAGSCVTLTVQADTEIHQN